MGVYDYEDVSEIAGVFIFTLVCKHVCRGPRVFVFWSLCVLFCSTSPLFILMSITSFPVLHLFFFAD